LNNLIDLETIYKIKPLQNLKAKKRKRVHLLIAQFIYLIEPNPTKV
jgi:hypothetical protein